MSLSFFSLHRRELFQKTSGARENAVKILVVITDGEKYGDPLNYEDVIPEADRAGVIRYVIGVGNGEIGPGTSVEIFYRCVLSSICRYSSN